MGASVALAVHAAGGVSRGVRAAACDGAGLPLYLLAAWAGAGFGAGLSRPRTNLSAARRRTNPDDEPDDYQYWPLPAGGAHSDRGLRARQLSLPRAGRAKSVRFIDGNLGEQSFTAVGAPGPHVDAVRAFGDFLVWRRPLTNLPEGIGLPSYQLACVVDDAFQQITEVVRGADLLKSTARQMLLQRALGLATPAYFHTRLLRDECGVRLAKRHDALAIRTLREQGLTPGDVLTRIAAQASIAPV